MNSRFEELKKFLEKFEKVKREKKWDEQLKDISEQLKKIFPPSEPSNYFHFYFKPRDRKNDSRRSLGIYALF